MGEKILEIIKAGIKAPSGENCQPWRFVIEGNKLTIINDPNSDTSLYNFKQRGSLIAHGAAIENMRIAASVQGFDCNITYFPNSDDQNIIAEIIFTEGISTKSDLFNEIDRRVTNRKQYLNKSISETDILTLKNISNNQSTIKVNFINEKSLIDHISESLSVNERIIFESKHLHDFFYNHIRWTKDEDKKDSTGFFIDTLELDNKQKTGFKVFKNWKLLRIANKILGASKLVAADNKKNYQSASAIGAIISQSNDDFDYIKCGEIFERLWLTATKLEISLQPATGVIFLCQGVLEGHGHDFTETQVNLIKDAYTNIKRIFNAKDDRGKVLLLFRIGYSEVPTARSSRKDYKDFLITKN